VRDYCQTYRVNTETNKTAADQPTPRSRLHRLPERGSYEVASALAIVEQVGHGTVAYQGDQGLRILPTLLWCDPETVYIHGSSASRAIRDLADGRECCLNAYTLDGVVVARSAQHMSVNYQSATLFGVMEVVPEDRKTPELAALVNRMTPGRWDEIRKPSPAEDKSVTVLQLAITDCSVKVRTGPPVDDEADYDLPIWAGVVPMSRMAGTPIADPRLSNDQPAPRSLDEIHFG